MAPRRSAHSRALAALALVAGAAFAHPLAAQRATPAALRTAAQRITPARMYDRIEFLASDLDLLVISTPLTDKTRHLSACQPSIPSQPINGPCYSSLLVYLRLTIDDAVSAPEFEVLAKKKAFVSNIGRGPIGA